MLLDDSELRNAQNDMRKKWQERRGAAQDGLARGERGKKEEVIEHSVMRSILRNPQIHGEYV